jgi:5-formyltetrahydrofolate cyclo-ligase
VALAFDEQVLAAGERLPAEAHDVGMQVVVTPTEVVRIAGK